MTATAQPRALTASQKAAADQSGSASRGTVRNLSLIHISQIDGVQVHLQDLVLAVVLLQGQGPVHLGHLALDGVLVIAGDVLDELLGDRCV